MNKESAKVRFHQGYLLFTVANSLASLLLPLSSSENSQKGEHKVEERDRVCDEVLLIFHVEAVLEEASRCNSGPDYHCQRGDASQDPAHLCEDGQKGQDCEGKERVAKDANRLVELNILVLLAHQVDNQVYANAA